METDNESATGVLGGHPPTRTAARNLLKVANGLVSRARPWQHEITTALAAGKSNWLSARNSFRVRLE
jgi:hypothetical protein